MEAGEDSNLTTILEAAAKFVAVLALVIICGAMVGQVLFRYVLNAPLQWSETVSVYALVWVVFLGAGVLAFTDSHVSIQSLTDKLSPRGRAASTVFVRLCAIIFAVLVCLLAYDWITTGRHVMAASLGISTKWIKLALPIGVALIGIASLIRLAGDIAAIRREDWTRFPKAHDGED